MVDTRDGIELLEKNQPRQERAKQTYEAILRAAAELLIEVGVERISTNMMAERAGVTVPALYRYFPNKYAVLYVLGARLMDRQNKVFQDWFLRYVEPENPHLLLNNITELLQQIYLETGGVTAGIQILQSLRAVAPLQDVRLKSHRMLAEQFYRTVAHLFDLPPDERIAARARVSIETGYSVVEMALEDDTVDRNAVLEEGAHMISLYWREVLPPVQR